MSTLTTLALFTCILLCFSSVQAITHHQVNQFDQLPQDNLGTYQSQSCCPPGFNVAGEYCVRCAEPSHWNPYTQKCVTCAPNEPWNNLTHTCDCCPPPRIIQAGICQCPLPKTQWDPNSKTCSCPPNTFG